MVCIRSVCVYCGSNSGFDEKYVKAAQAAAQAIVRRQLTLVYGGGHTGLMGAVADAALHAGSNKVIGIIPELLKSKEKGHRGVRRLEIVPDMHTRKKRMIDLADSFITLPGGAGTLEELFEVYTWAQLGYHQKPIGLINVNGFFNPLLAMIDNMVNHGFLHPAYRETLYVANDANTLLDKFKHHTVIDVDKWSLDHQLKPNELPNNRIESSQA